MEVPAGDERTDSLLLTRYKASGCYYCMERRKEKRKDHTHMNCPFRPCYICKKLGHRANDCPYRMLPNAHETALHKLSENREKRSRKFHFLREREIEVVSERMNPSILHFRSRQFDCKAAFIGRKLHEKRITAVEWIPGSDTMIISGDKCGVLRLWNIGDSLQKGWLDVDAIPKGKVTTTHAHHCNINQIALDPSNHEIAYTSSSDGLLCEVRLSKMGDRDDIDILKNLNPQGWQGEISLFKMIYGLRYHPERHCLFAGVSDGAIVGLDPRATGKPIVHARFHKDKVTSIDVNPVSSDLLATSSNDRDVRLWDARKFVPGHEIGSYTHGRVASSAFFSPNTGSKLLTTSLDNKIQIWNDVHAFNGNVNELPNAAPLEIIHSHDFHRYLNAFRAMWDPKDWRDDLFICGRYLGDAYCNENDSTEATVLHPIDMFSAKTGSSVHSMVDFAMPLICPINKFAPNADCVLTAASRDLVLWSPPPDGFKADSKMKRVGGRRGTGGNSGDGNGDDNGDDDDDSQPRKRTKLTKTTLRTRASRRRTAT